MNRKKGFTLVELLAVLGILGILVTLASTSVLTILNKQRETLAKEMQDNMLDAAISYIQDKRITLKKCNSSFNPETPDPTESNCYRIIKVADIVNSGLIDDNSEYCDRNADIIVYKATLPNYTELRSYAKEGICK